MLLALVVVLVATGSVGAGIYSAINDVEDAVDARKEDIRRFEAGETTVLVKNWLGSRPVNFSCVEGYDLYFHELTSAGQIIERKFGDGNWAVAHRLTAGDYFWKMYEDSLAIDTLVKPSQAPC